MRAIAAAFGWKGHSFAADELWRRLVQLAPQIDLRSQWDTLTDSEGCVGCAGEERWLRRGAVAVAAESSFLACGDCRLFDRAALGRAAGRPSTDVPDVELVLSAQATWGDDFPKHLTGDFAVVVHDSARDQVLLATGGSGARQLYYRRYGAGVLIASHPALLQAASMFHQSDVDVGTVRRYLLGRLHDPYRTFFTDVIRVPPGRQVVLRSGSTIWRRHFEPPMPGADRPPSADLYAEFRELFEKCVTDAVEPGAHHGVHLSGGLDSSSIATTLPRIDTQGATFELLTATFPTIRACDEASAAAAVAQRLPFRARSWNGERIAPIADEVALWVWPLGVLPTVLGNRDDYDIAARAGAVALLTGNGGDAIATESAVFNDLARNRHWRLLWNELAAGELSGFARQYLMKKVVADFSSRVLRRRPTTSPPSPAWLGDALVDLDESVEISEPRYEDRLPDLVQQQVWRSVTDATNMWWLEALSLRAQRAGLELRSPYTDPRLTALVISFRYPQRVCGGVLRRLQRKGLDDRLPVAVRRRVKVNFEPAMRSLIRREWDIVKPLLEAAEWRAEPYVRKAQFYALVDQTAGCRAGDVRDWFRIRQIWSLELWLRRLAV